MDVISEHFDFIQSRIRNCEFCQQADSNHDLWSYGLRIDLNQLFLEYEIEENERDIIIEHLKCPVCSNTDFNEFSFVGVDFSEIDIYLTEAHRSSIIYYKQIQEFNDFLRNYPSLALNHPIGKSLLKNITENSFKTKQIHGLYFRSRKYEGANVFNLEQMKVPPVGVSGQGRYNYDGQNHFYISSTKNTAIREGLQGSKEDVIVCVQKFEIEYSIDKILDLREIQVYSKNSLELLNKALLCTGFLVRKEGEVGNWKPDYFLTRFIMDCAKYAKYNGIIYNSASDLNSHNVVLFNGNDRKIQPKGNPKIIRPNEIFPQSDSSLPF